MMGERFFSSTDKEREKVLGNYFKQWSTMDRSTVFPSKEKRKYIIAQEIIKRFDSRESVCGKRDK